MNRKQRTELYKTVFEAGNGPAVLDDLKDEFWIADSTFVAENATETAYREGQRSVVLHLIHTLAQKPDLEKLIQERLNNVDRNSREPAATDAQW